MWCLGYCPQSTTPGSLSAHANGGHEIDLSWTASSSPLGIAGYDIFRDGSGTALATVSGATLAYADKGLADDLNASHGNGLKAVAGACPSCMAASSKKRA